MSIHGIFWALRRALGLSPTQRVFRELRARGLKLTELDTLDAFAHTGFLQTKDYHPLVKSLEAWEVNPAKEPELRRNLPGARIKTGDSFQEIRRTEARFDLVVLDPPSAGYGEQRQYHEYFEFLPEAMRVLKDRATVVLNVVPGGIHEEPGGKFAFSETHLARRASFYGTTKPERMRLEEMHPAHQALVEAHGFTLEWHYATPRTLNNRLWYLVLHLRRNSQRAPAA